MIRAEILKLTTVPATKIAVAVGLLGLLFTQLLSVPLLAAVANGAVPIPNAEFAAELQGFQPGSFAFQYAALNVLGGGVLGGSTGSLGIATMAIVIVGLLVATTDYRHGGIVTTALAEPRRGKLLAGKVIATAVTAAVVGAAFAVVSLLVLLGTTWLQPLQLSVTPVDAVATLLLGIVVVVLLALLGLAIGILVRSQIAGFVVLVSVMLLEPIVQSIAQFASGAVPLWTQFLPQTLAHTALAPLGQGVLPWWVALVALVALAGAALAAASVSLKRRDL